MSLVASSRVERSTEVSLKQQAVRGVWWTVCGDAVAQVLRLLSNLALTRLLFPEAFGVMALVHVCMSGLSMLSDVGVEASVIQDPRGANRDYLDTAWSFQIVRGIVLWIAACLIAWPVARIYAANDPAAGQLVALLPVLGVGAFVSGFVSTKLIVAKRRMEYARPTMIGLVSQFAALASMIVLAIMYRSVWALALGGLASPIVRVTLSHIAIPGDRNRLRWNREHARTLFHFGKWIFVSTAITFFALQADRILLGTLVPLDVLGVYSIGLMVAFLPKEIIDRVTGAVLFPALAKQRRQSREAFPEKVRAARDLILPVAVFALLGVVLLAPSFFRILYDERYHDAGWMAQLLCIAVWISVLKSTVDRALLALGNSRVLAFSNFANLVAVAVGCGVGYLMFGLPGFILGYSISSLAGYVVIAHVAHRAGITVVRQDLMYTSLLVCLAALGLLIPAAFSQVVSDTRLQGAIVVGWSMLLLLGCGIWAFRRVVPVVWIR